MYNRKTILLVTRLSATALAIWFAVVSVMGSATLVDLYAFAILRGLTMSFDQAPRRAMIPSMVPAGAVVNALALTNGGQQVTRATAPAVAGVLISLWGIPAAFVAMAVLYVVGFPFLLLVRIADHEREGYRGLRRIFSDTGAGLGFALRNPVVRACLVLTALYFIFGMSFTNVFAPLLAEGPLGLDEGGLGWLVAVMGIGGTAGTLVVAYFSPSHRRGTVLTTSLALFGMLLMGMAGATYLPTAIVAFVVIFFVGAGQSIFMPLLHSIVLQAAPPNMRGRAVSILSWDRALVSFGSAVAGFAAGAFGSQATLLAFGGACVLGGLALLATGALRRVD
jgi:MFS family permease